MSKQEDDDVRLPEREYEHRVGDRRYRRRQALRLFKRLEQAYQKTDPEAGNDTAKGKDYAAREALNIAGDLCELIAGWAVDHAVGKAMNGEEFLPWYAQTTRQNPDFIALRMQADQHEHEREGSTLNRRWNPSFNPDPRVTRVALLNLIQSNSGGLPRGMRSQAVEALRALAYGEVLPLFAPNPAPYAKRKWRELNSQLGALSHVEFRAAKGIKRKIALQEVGDAYGVSPDTIRSWGQRIRDELGDLEVADRLQRAKNLASHAAAPSHLRDESMVKYIEDLYGPTALSLDGATSRKIAAELANDKAKPSRGKKNDAKNEISASEK